MTTVRSLIDDYRILEISIYGEQEKQTEAFETLTKYLYNLTQGITRTLTLKGIDKPFGVIKEMFQRFGMDLGKLRQENSNLHCLQIDLKKHSISISGTDEGVDKAIDEINNVIESLRKIQDPNYRENDKHQCSICLTKIEDGKMYRLESCCHAFCKTCIIPQLESAVSNNDFPVSCCKQDCGEMWSWRDLTKVSVQSGMSINNLVNRATSAFISKNDQEYKYCISPDCPSIYRITTNGEEFVCFECGIRICTTCHKQFHDGLTCDLNGELVGDSSGIMNWLEENKRNRKRCPKCGIPIEKNGGCNHMECIKCGRHICWVCLDHFETMGSCYGHLSRVHNNFGGGY